MSMQVKMLSEQAYEVSGLSIRDIQRQKFCVFNLEATGVQVDTERIIQIGAVYMDSSGVNSEEAFSTYIKPAKPISQEIETLTGIYNGDVENAPRLEEVYGQFLDFAEGCILVTHAGYEFDLPLLQRECLRQSLAVPTNPCIDTKALFTYLHPEVEDIISTDFLLNYYGLDSKGMQRHDALGESLLIGQIFLEMLRELESIKIEHLQFSDPVTVKRFKLPPLSNRPESSKYQRRFPAPTGQQRSLFLSIIVLFLLTASLTGLVDMLTFRLRWNGHLSGNGNPAMLVVFLLIPLYIALLYLMGMTFRNFFHEKMKDGWYSSGIITFLIVMAGVLGFFAYGYYRHIFKGLGGGPENLDSALFRWGYWNQYTNTAYINILTYSLGLVCSMIAGYVAAWFNRKKQD
ncbi:exonuclease, DNA polymerase III, epsilon subunit family [Paenibacillus uliginis N3/975]|uniref:Exonuclease, DNA polymerase III, epsilon subunit family n=1 Tax=Paenibacillus uliginis N3/975 TaxID=1313296 RepID=A0A1X7HT44_9BACL|nr:3'-5' exonuclease [Paenibacillus uliginis]SMF92417.1 exonuclease, DNA polymerase III, epsilon subunit family [Paenibacillus uliginis N3/975]